MKRLEADIRKYTVLLMTLIFLTFTKADIT
jgi:hypothetical protein